MTHLKFIGSNALYRLLTIVCNEINELKSKISPQITDSTSVTESGKYALDAIENNASIDGTLANKIMGINKLSANITKVNVYVSGSGNDTNADGSTDKPFATLKAALKYLCSYGNPDNGVVIWFQQSVIIPGGDYYFPPRIDYKFKGEAQFSGGVNFHISGCNITLEYFKVHVLKASRLRLHTGGSYVGIQNEVILYMDYAEVWNTSYLEIIGAVIYGHPVFDNVTVKSLALRLTSCVYLTADANAKKWIVSTHYSLLNGTKSEYTRLQATDNAFIPLS